MMVALNEATYLVKERFMRSRKAIFTLVKAIVPTLVLTLVFTGCADTDSSRPAGEVLVDELGVAIEGFDTVAYHLADTAVQGQSDYATQWNGATWWFSSQTNRQLFIAEPEKYAPAYGGWCAYGVAEGYAAETDPVNGWTIHEGRLYLNWDAEVSADWRTDKAGYLKKSEPNWSTVQTQLQEGGATVYWHEE
ncbi:MAG: YHS domain-containing protein [Halioglobus sp.]|jgi:YHS domain-containing protein